MAIRRMSLTGWPEFTSGGALWFPDLTQAAVTWGTMSSHLGLLGAVLPLCVTLAYLGSIEVMFNKSRLAPHAGNPIGRHGPCISIQCSFACSVCQILSVIVLLRNRKLMHSCTGCYQYHRVPTASCNNLAGLTVKLGVC